MSVLGALAWPAPANRSAGLRCVTNEYRCRGKQDPACPSGRAPAKGMRPAYWQRARRAAGSRRRGVRTFFIFETLLSAASFHLVADTVRRASVGHLAAAAFHPPRFDESRSIRRRFTFQSWPLKYFFFFYILFRVPDEYASLCL